MADSILRLKVDSQEYDNKLKRAAEGLQRYAEGCRKAGGTLTQLDDGVEDFVRELGKMETVSKSAKGSISEMTKAFTDLSVQYNKLTDEEKNSPFGKALAQSLETLKGRIQEGNNELKTISGSINDTGGFLNALKDKFTINIDALKLFNAGVTAAKAALDVAKDAFFASESNVDEWGRTIQAAQSVYEGFLISINNGDISGFLRNIDDIVKAARAAYNELDKLNTMRTIQSPGFAKQEAENNRMRTMLMTGKWISAADGRVSPLGLKDGDKLTPEMMRVIERQLQGGMNKIVSLTKNEIGQTGKAINAYYNSLAKQNGMSLSEFRSGTSSWESFSQKMAGYEAYKRWDAQARTEFAKQGGRGYVDFDKNNPYAEYRKWGTFRVDKMGENSYNDLVNLIKQQQSQQSQLYSTMGQAYRTMNRVNGETIRDIMGGGRSGGGGGRGGAGGSGVDIYALVAGQWDKAMLNGAGAGVKATDMTGPSEAWEAYVASVKNGSQEATDSLQSLIDAFNKLNEAEGVTPTGELAQDGKKIKSSWGDAASAISGVGSALSSIEDPTAKILGIVAQAIAGVAAGAGQAVSAKDTTSSGWAWIGAAAAITASMVAMISQIHSATGYANGGIVRAAGGTVVPGNNYSGDMVPAMLNSGELVLNRAQQGNLASQLEGGSMRNLQLSATIKGEDIRLALNNNGRRTGRGEYVTTNFT
jgi:hypothetical protein